MGTDQLDPWEQAGQKKADFDRRMAETDRALSLPVGLTKAQLLQESKLDPAAISHAGARGIAQVIPATQRALEKRMGRKLDPHNVDDALEMHRELMRENLVRFKGDVDAALKAYNNGPNPARWNNPETSSYPLLIRQRLERLVPTDPWERRSTIQGEPTSRFPGVSLDPWEVRKSQQDK